MKLQANEIVGNTVFLAFGINFWRDVAKFYENVMVLYVKGKVSSALFDGIVQYALVLKISPTQTLEYRTPMLPSLKNYSSCR